MYVLCIPPVQRCMETCAIMSTPVITKGLAHVWTSCNRTFSGHYMLGDHWIEASGHAKLWWLWLKSFLLIVFSFQGLACYLTPVQYPLSFSYFNILLLLWADWHCWWCFLSLGIDMSNGWPFCEHGCSFFPLELEVGAAICSSVLNAQDSISTNSFPVKEKFAMLSNSGWSEHVLNSFTESFFLCLPLGT